MKMQIQLYNPSKLTYRLINSISTCLNAVTLISNQVKNDNITYNVRTEGSIIQIEGTKIKQVTDTSETPPLAPLNVLMVWDQNI